MIASWSELSQELLSTIFENIESVMDLLQLQLLCKSWSTAAYKQLYRSISLRNMPPLSLVHTLIESKHESRFCVKMIDFGKQLPCESVLESDEGNDPRLLVLRLCPNITRLQATDLKAPETLYTQLFALRNQGYLQHVQYLPAIKYLRSFQNAAFRNVYKNTAIAMKETLAHLYIMRNNQYSHPHTSDTILF